jgi:hypothetical protein
MAHCKAQRHEDAGGLLRLGGGGGGGGLSGPSPPALLLLLLLLLPVLSQLRSSPPRSTRASSDGRQLRRQPLQACHLPVMLVLLVAHLDLHCFDRACTCSRSKGPHSGQNTVIL